VETLFRIMSSTLAGSLSCLLLLYIGGPSEKLEGFLWRNSGGFQIHTCLYVYFRWGDILLIDMFKYRICYNICCQIYRMCPMIGLNAGLEPLHRPGLLQSRNLQTNGEDGGRRAGRDCILIRSVLFIGPIPSLQNPRSSSTLQRPCFVGSH
jgi:hypothetical protein